MDVEKYIASHDPNQKTLVLSGNNLIELPENITQLSQLTDLRLGYNKLTSLPECIGQFSQLTELYLGENQLTSLPESIGQLFQLADLYLYNNQLTLLPESFSQLSELTTLNIGRNKLASLPESITQLSQLTTLIISRNLLASLPESITQLNQLTTLDLGYNKLTSLPESIGQLDQLTGLYIGRNQLASVPESVSRLKQLTTLNLNKNQLTSLPESVTQLSQLTTLSLNNNQLTSLPESIGKLSRITKLDLRGNQLTSLPESIGQLSQLAELDLSHNQLTTLPESISLLSEVCMVYLSGNPLEKPPREIADRGIGAIRDYFEQIRQQDVDYLYEAKMLIVGDPGAGKTTLMQKILNADYPVPSDTDSTVGVNVREWYFDFEKELGKVIRFRANLWDFGGQKIQCMTHQFFLTSRSFYVLVSDNRDQRVNFDYWFNLIEILGEKSPVLVLLNDKLHQSVSNFSETHYRKHYPDMITEVRDIDFANEDGRYQTLVNHLKTRMASLKHIGDPLPKQWIPIRDELEIRKTNHSYISFEDYKNICRKYGLSDEKHQLTLSQYLHDLGTLLHFQDDPDISHWVILEPRWVIDAVYAILVDKTVHHNYGRFNKSWLFDQWDEYGKTEQNFLLSLMLKNRFDICYATDTNQCEYIVPQLLPVEEPLYQFDRSDNLIFRNQYKFMPFGLLPRIIVRLSDEIDQQNGQAMNWQTGVIIKDENKGVKALIEESTSEEGLKIINIRVAGNIIEQKEYLAHIRKTIHTIHKESYKDIVYDAMIPCNQCVQNNSESPKYFAYKELTKWIEKSVKQQVCGVCGEVFSPSELVFGISSIWDSEKARHFYIDTYVEGQYMNSIKIGDNANVGGDVNNIIAEKIENSFNKVSQSENVSQELKDLLKDLSDQINAIKEQLSGQVAEDIADDFESLSKEATRKEPRPKRYQLSAEGLVDAAKTVGNIADPIIGTTTKIIDFLSKSVIV